MCPIVCPLGFVCCCLLKDEFFCLRVSFAFKPSRCFGRDLEVLDDLQYTPQETEDLSAIYFVVDGGVIDALELLLDTMEFFRIGPVQGDFGNFTG